VPWTNEASRRAGTVHVGGTWQEVASAERDVFRGIAAERPFVLAAQQSIFDDTRAPAGKHTLWAYCHVPNGCTIDMTDRIDAQIERFAPGFRDLVLARHVTPPAALEQYNANYKGGDIAIGAPDDLQVLFRPRIAVDPYKIGDGIWLCSAATPPGGGVHGLCGMLAAQSVLRESD
jgi:phytoene dehydrogenase-like protein